MILKSVCDIGLVVGPNLVLKLANIADSRSPAVCVKIQESVISYCTAERCAFDSTLCRFFFSFFFLQRLKCFCFIYIIYTFLKMMIMDYFVVIVNLKLFVAIKFFEF